jgi:DNA-binding response OmpR family regulator
MSAFEQKVATRRVLIVECDRALGNLLCRVLNHDDRFVVAAAVGSSKRAIAFRDPFDVALVDILVDGILEAIAVLRARVPPPAVVVRAPFIAAYLRAAVAAAGANAVVATGAGMADLLDLLACCSPSAPSCSVVEGPPQVRSGTPDVVCR